MILLMILLNIHALKKNHSYARKNQIGQKSMEHMTTILDKLYASLMPSMGIFHVILNQKIGLKVPAIGNTHIYQNIHSIIMRKNLH